MAQDHVAYLRQNSFRIAEFNVENLFVLLDESAVPSIATISEDQWQKQSSSVYPNKPLVQLRALAQAIESIDADVFALCEVGGLESLVNFNKYFLKEKYNPHLIEGNSDRGIDLGYLVKKSLPLKFDLLSHKHRSLDFLYPHERQAIEAAQKAGEELKIASHKFSRDVLELRIFDGNSQPSLIVLAAHLKSQLDPDGIDPLGRDRRRAELEKLVKIHNEIELEFSGQVPIIICGDFNGIAAAQSTDPEFSALYQKTKLRDALEVAVCPLDQTFTHIQINSYGPSHYHQLDYVFLPPALHAKVQSSETFVYRYKDEFGMRLLVPRNLYEKRLLPSDHYPVVVTFSNIS